MNPHRYPPSVLLPDYVRAAVGIAVTAGPLPFLGGSPITQGILGTLAVVFVGFAVSTVVRQATRVTCDEQGVSTAGLRSSSVRWSDIDRIALRYFSTRRDRTNGWMQLEVGGGGQTVRIDSGLDGFDAIAQTAFTQAAARGVALDPTTSTNAAAAGLSYPTAGA